MTAPLVVQSFHSTDMNSTGKLADAAMAKALQDHVKQGIAPYKYPRLVEFVSEVPKTPSGKVQRFVLRAAEVARQAALMPYEQLLPARLRGKNERIDEPMAQAPARRTA